MISAVTKVCRSWRFLEGNGGQMHNCGHILGSDQAKSESHSLFMWLSLFATPFFVNLPGWHGIVSLHACRPAYLCARRTFARFIISTPDNQPTTQALNTPYSLQRSSLVKMRDLHVFLGSDPLPMRTCFRWKEWRDSTKSFIVVIVTIIIKIVIKYLLMNILA